MNQLANIEQALAQIARLEYERRYPEAQSAYQQLLSAHPNFAEGWHGFGLLLLAAGFPSEAAQMAGKAVMLEPNNLTFQRNFGEICRRIGLLDQAIASGKEALKIAPKDLDATFNLGLAYSDSKDFLKAVEYYRKALRIDSTHASSWNNLGAALEALGEQDEALKAYLKAADLEPKNAQAQNNAGVIYVEKGILKNAVERFNLAISVKPDFVECHYNLSSLKTYTPDDPHLGMLEAINPHQHVLSDVVRIQYNFALGKALEDVGQYDRAFEAYALANRIQHALLPVDEERAEVLLEGIIKTFTPEFFEKRKTWSDNTASPIFIVGMPRSGTTLLEQILSTHPSVHGAGELINLSEAIHGVVKPGQSQSFTDKLLGLAAPQFKKIAKEYQKQVWALSPKSEFITDKMPANFMYLGLIHLLFPNAKIIHAMRDPMDSCFSCFARLFNDTMDMAYDLETIGRYYDRYMRLMHHWQKVLPAGRVLDLHYEELVEDTEGQARRILEYVGLPWNPDCLEFHKNERVVKTASLAQVNKPIYKTSVARWRRFGKHLQPLINLVKQYRPAEDYSQYDATPLAIPSAAPANTPAPIVDGMTAADREAQSIIAHCLELQAKNLQNEVVQFLEKHLHERQMSPQVWHLAGISFYKLLRFQESKACYERALQLEPNFPLALNSYGFLLQDLCLLEEAENVLTHALNVSPEFAMARFNLSTVQLKRGRYLEGWENYESRWVGSAEAASNNLQMPDCPLPKWFGQAGTENQSLLVITEQGFGDTFQFVRYLPLLTKHFRKVGFVCSMPTLRLMEWAFNNDIAIFNRMPTDYGVWDWQAPLLSLPKALKTTLETIPQNVPYLRVPPVVQRHWAERVNRAGQGCLKIGIAWAGRNTHHADSRRSIPFEKLFPLFGMNPVAFFSLQKWAPGDLRPAMPPQVRWFDWTDEFIDFADTAGLMTNLDLIISIDSAPVHLAGALNVPVWMLNRYDGEWRWLHGINHSPWYPSVRLFNQPQFGDWDSVVANVMTELQKLPLPASLNNVPMAPANASVAQPIRIESIAQAIQLANQLQSSGQLKEAEQVIMQILAVDPHHANALHLYGILLHQAGMLREAIEKIEQAIASNPNDVLFYSNVAEMCRQAGRTEEAIAWGQKAVKIDPMAAAAFSNLGVAYFDAGNFDEAEDCHLKALVLEPNLIQSLNTLGSIERARKNTSAAIEWYQKVLAIQPQFLETLSNLGAVLVESERFNEAQSVLERSIEINPNYPAGLCNLGLVRIKQNRLDEAISLLQRSLQLKPGYPEALIGLARAHYEAEEMDLAASLLRDLLDHDPGRADAYALLGLINTELGHSQLAAQMYEKVLELNPESLEAHNGLGNLRMEAGDLQAAQDLFRRALELDPSNADARFYLTQVNKVTADDSNTEAIETMLAAGVESVDKRISLHYALGKAYDDLGQYEKAFQQFSEGARLKRGLIQFDVNEDARLTNQVIELTPKSLFENLKGEGNPSKAPIFVLGMPRSGTTLVEQIIATHSQVYGAGELPDLLDILNKHGIQMGLNGYPDVLKNIDVALLKDVSHEYLDRLSKLSGDAQYVTDKMPSNYFAMGLIHLLFPNAKIIHVKRDPIDTCLSCFMRLFNRRQEGTYDLAELGSHYVNYRRLMQHWESVMPKGSFLDVQYEDLVANTEAESRRLFEFCGLEWDPACLEFYKNKRVIRTASVSQVRQPIYSSSVNRWAHYEKHLEPLLAALSNANII